MELRSSIVKENSGILDATLAGIEEWIGAIWRARVRDPIVPVMTSSSFEIKKQLEIWSKRTKDQPLPQSYITVVPAQYERSMMRGNSFLMQREGIRVGNLNGKDLEVREKVFPLDMSFGVRFTTSDLEEAMMFAQIWLSKAPVSSFDILHQDTGAKVRIKLRLDPQLAQPEAEFGGDPGDKIKVDTTLIVETYSGETEINTTIRKIVTGFYDKSPLGWVTELETKTQTYAERYALRYGS